MLTVFLDRRLLLLPAFSPFFTACCRLMVATCYTVDTPLPAATLLYCRHAACSLMRHVAVRFVMHHPTHAATLFVRDIAVCVCRSPDVQP